MTQQDYRQNHYVPVWYQRRFLPSTGPNTFFYLDLRPETISTRNGHSYTQRALQVSRGPNVCFKEKDLYTTVFQGLRSTEIEREFFGQMDSLGPAVVDSISNFKHPTPESPQIVEFLKLLSLQKLRTKKGLLQLKDITLQRERNALLREMQELHAISCATWMECTWQIADASRSITKFILSDHPVTYIIVDADRTPCIVVSTVTPTFAWWEVTLFFHSPQKSS